MGDVTFDVLSLFERCGAIKVGHFVIGSKSSRFITISVVKVCILDREKLAEIQYFTKCTVKCGNSSKYIWLAAVCLFPDHQCKVWYGSPTEVYGGLPDTDIHFLPVNEIQNRVTFTRKSENFGQYIGIDNVIIVTPLY